MMEFAEARELAKKYDPSQPRDKRNGRWSDRLGLAGRAALADGWRVVASDRGVAESSDDELSMVALRGPDGPELRFGHGGSEQDEPGTFDPDTYDDPSEVPEDMRWRASEGGTTARFAGDELDLLAEELAAVEDLRQMVSRESAELGEEIWPDGATDHPEGVSWPMGAKGWQYDTPEREAHWSERMDRAHLLTDGGEIYSGVIPGRWADIHWDVVGVDTEGTKGKGDWARTRLYVRPHADRDATYLDLYGQLDGMVPNVELTAREVAKLMRQIESMRTAAREE